MKEYMTAKETAEKWGVTVRRIQSLCKSGRLNQAVKFGRDWMIPCDTVRPDDNRVKRHFDTGLYAD